MIPRAVFLAAAFLCVMLPSSVAAETLFLKAIEDVPLAPGLEEDGDASYLFPTTAGRIVETAATGVRTESLIRDYYRIALPPLGWTLRTDSAAMTFDRNREHLRLKFETGKNGAVSVRFRLVTGAASEALD